MTTRHMHIAARNAPAMKRHHRYGRPPGSPDAKPGANMSQGVSKVAQKVALLLGQIKAISATDMERLTHQAMMLREQGKDVLATLGISYADVIAFDVCHNELTGGGMEA